MLLAPAQISTFQRTVLKYFARHGRAMPWRSDPRPYFVLLSEIMLQQTQVARVIPKFNEFTARFPTLTALADAPLGDVLAVWSGLGYNRRAKFLHDAAKLMVAHHDSQVPASAQALEALPGLGPNTAGAILVYAFNEPAVFVETNIRTVFICHFFAESSHAVRDAELRDLVAQTLAVPSREWYWALMDYGAHLKTTDGAQLQRVHAHRPQSCFEGSRRQVRGQVLKLLIVGPSAPAHLAQAIPDIRLPEVLEALEREGLIVKKAGRLQLTR